MHPAKNGGITKGENEEIADLLVGLTDARKTWGFGLSFLHLSKVKGHLWNHKRVYPLGGIVLLAMHIPIPVEPGIDDLGERGGRNAEAAVEGGR
ncbi:hypothetical protein MCELHM10_02773 [Paracoccaceae bacterium]|jgi:hypothetical protein